MDTRDKVEKIIMDIAASMHAVDMYGREHKMVIEAINGLYDALSEVLKEVKSVTIGVIGDELAYEKHPFYDTSKKVKGLVTRLKKQEIEKFTFLSSVSKDDISLFVDLIARHSNAEDVKKFSNSAVLKNIRVGKIGMPEGEGEDTSFDDPDIESVMNKTYENGTEFLERTSEDVKNNRQIDADSARQIVGGIVNSLLKNRDLLRVLTSTKSHDESTFIHEVNVAIFTMMQAEALGMEEKGLNEIGVAALLHDAGKLAVTGDIIRKAEKLSETDIASLGEHPINGAKILLETPGVGVLAAVAAFEHHMQYDMSGYPKKKYGKAINLVTMMITIADFYDALRSERSYHEGASPEEVHRKMMEFSGKLFHSGLLENFFRTIGIYPPGSLVELDTGEIGIVVKENRLDKERPKVEILYGVSGEKLKDPYAADLSKKTDDGKYIKSILRSVAPSDKYES